MSRKISKSDTTPEMEKRADEARAEFRKLKSLHFTPGTFIWCDGNRGEVLTTYTCKCMFGDKMMSVRWDSGVTTEIQPKALNPNGIGHK